MLATSEIFSCRVLLCVGIMIYLCSVGNCLINNPQDPDWTIGKIFSFRLGCGKDLKKSLYEFVELHKLQATSIVTCVGSLRSLNIRTSATSPSAPSNYLVREGEYFEIVSLVGTLEMARNESAVDGEESYGHLHISVSDKEGRVWGGHLMEGNHVFTTAEITVMENPNARFTRELDPESGYEELVVVARDSSGA